MENLRGTACVRLINFQDPVHKNNFDIYDPVTIYIFPRESAQSHYIGVVT